VSSEFNNKSTVYGPVKSWRFGQSLGIDPIFKTSTCSFNCLYCQLGNIQKITAERQEFVPTEKVIIDLKELLLEHEKIDIITYSGSGEPTLATNLKEMILEIKKVLPNIPQNILTNATVLDNEEVIDALSLLDIVTVKIDALDDATYKSINRSVDEIPVEKIITNIKEFKKRFKGKLEIQTMIMQLNIKKMDGYLELIKELEPELVQINRPTRPYPLSWHRENRGNHKLIFDYEVRDLKQVDEELYENFVNNLKKHSGIDIIAR